jgi:hypothetical protein
MQHLVLSGIGLFSSSGAARAAARLSTFVLLSCLGVQTALATPPDDLIFSDGFEEGPLGLVGDCYVEATPGGTVDLAALVTGGAGTLSASLTTMSSGGDQVFTLTNLSLTVSATHPDGTPGYMGVGVRITRGNESIEIVVVVNFPSSGTNAFDAQLKSYDPITETPGSVLTGPQVLNAGDSVGDFFMEAPGAAWVCTENGENVSCAWCWAMSISTAVFIQRFVMGGDCSGGCANDQTCVLGPGGPTCYGSDAAMGAQCVANEEGNLYLTAGPRANQCSWLSGHIGAASSEAPPDNQVGNIPAVTGVDFSLGPTPQVTTCGLIAIRFRYTASPPLMCTERLQSGVGVSTFNAAFIFRSTTTP